MVSVQTPAPGLRRRRRAKEEEAVGVLVHDAGERDERAEEMIDAHGGDGFGVAFFREAG